MSSESDRKSKRDWYYRNKEKHRQGREALRQRNREWLRAFKASAKCARCPENHPACLEFHHVDDDKEVNVSDAVSKAWSIARIEKEIAKCIILCANCHRKEHASLD